MTIYYGGEWMTFLEEAKGFLGITETSVFDNELVPLISTCLVTLADFKMVDYNEDIDTCLGTTPKEYLPWVKQWILLSVRLLFDPPASDTIRKSLVESRDEMLFRISTARRGEG